MTGNLFRQNIEHSFLVINYMYRSNLLCYIYKVHFLLTLKDELPFNYKNKTELRCTIDVYPESAPPKIHVLHLVADLLHGKHKSSSLACKSLMFI